MNSHYANTTMPCRPTAVIKVIGPPSSAIRLGLVVLTINHLCIGDWNHRPTKRTNINSMNMNNLNVVVVAAPRTC